MAPLCRHSKKNFFHLSFIQTVWFRKTTKVMRLFVVFIVFAGIVLGDSGHDKIGVDAPHFDIAPGQITPFHYPLFKQVFYLSKAFYHYSFVHSAITRGEVNKWVRLIDNNFYRRHHGKSNYLCSWLFDEQRFYGKSALPC